MRRLTLTLLALVQTPTRTLASSTPGSAMISSSCAARCLALAALVLLGGCGSELLSPVDPGWEELCVVYAEPPSFKVTKSMFESCETIEVVIVILNPGP